MVLLPKTIRALERQDAKTIPIIAMTANAFREDAERCMEAGMNAHLAKPLDDEKCVMAVGTGCFYFIKRMSLEM